MYLYIKVPGAMINCHRNICQTDFHTKPLARGLAMERQLSQENQGIAKAGSPAEPSALSHHPLDDGF